MLSNILKMDGVKELSKREQSTFFGGTAQKQEARCCNPTYACCVPQPIPVSCCGTPAPNCTYAYGDLTCQGVPTACCI